MKQNFPQKNIANGEKYSGALSIQTELEAQEYFLACVNHRVSVFNQSTKEAEAIERENIAFYAHYMATHGSPTDDELINRISTLFHIEVEMERIKKS